MKFVVTVNDIDFIEFDAHSEREFSHSMIDSAYVMGGWAFGYDIKVYYTSKDGSNHMVGWWSNKECIFPRMVVHDFRDLPKLVFSNVNYWDNIHDLDVKVQECLKAMESGGKVYCRFGDAFVKVLKFKKGGGLWAMFPESYCQWVTLVPREEFLIYPPYNIAHSEPLQPLLFSF